MSEQWTNELGQPIGAPLPEWRPPPRPGPADLVGTWCSVQPLAPRHAQDLFAANALDVEGRNWTYLGYGPFASLEPYRAWVDGVCDRDDPLFLAIVDRERGAPVGVASYLRIEPGAGSIEVGHINYSPLLQRRRAATEAMFLMMRNVFDLGYRRYEWKCDVCNAPSRRAAERLGFRYEGLFRQALVYKGRNRDTTWFSIIDAEWPALRRAYEAWLSPENFGPDGGQRRPLAALVSEARVGNAASDRGSG